MKEGCIFCEIANKVSSAKIVYEDERVVAFLDIDPITEGHTILIPKAHFDDILDIEEDLLQHLAVVSKKIAVKIYDVLLPDGFNILQNNKNTGGKVKHYHAYIIPRWLGKDGIKMMHVDAPPQEDLFAKLNETLDKIKLVD